MMAVEKSMRTEVIERLAQHDMRILDALGGRLDVVVCAKNRSWLDRLLGRWKLVGFYRMRLEGIRFRASFNAVNEAAAKRLEAAIPEAAVSY